MYELYGIDVGSTTVKLVILNDKNELLFSEYMRHYLDIKNTVRSLFKNEEERREFDERHKNASVKRGDIADAEGALFFGIDVGSTTIKAALIDADGRLLYSYYGKNEGSPITSGIAILKEMYLKERQKPLRRKVSCSGCDLP